MNFEFKNFVCTYGCTVIEIVLKILFRIVYHTRIIQSCCCAVQQFVTL